MAKPKLTETMINQFRDSIIGDKCDLENTRLLLDILNYARIGLKAEADEELHDDMGTETKYEIGGHSGSSKRMIAVYVNLNMPFLNRITYALGFHIATLFGYLLAALFGPMNFGVIETSPDGKKKRYLIQRVK